MKLIIITSDPEMEEIERIKEESQKLRVNIEVLDYSDFHFSYVDGQVSFHPEIVEGDVAIIRGIFSAFRSFEPIKDYLKHKGIKVFDNNVFDHKYIINKVYDMTKLILAGVAVPNFYHSRSYQPLFDYASTMDYPAVAKSAGSGKGASIHKLNNRQEMESLLRTWQNQGFKAAKVVMQNFIDYKYDLRVLVIGDEMYCMRRIPKEGDFRANFSLGGSVEVFPINDDIRKLANQAIQAVGLKVAGVDILIDKEDKLYVLEVNHTPGFVGMEKATDLNIGEIYLKFAIENAREL